VVLAAGGAVGFVVRSCRWRSRAAARARPRLGELDAGLGSVALPIARGRVSAGGDIATEAGAWGTSAGAAVEAGALGRGAGPFRGASPARNAAEGGAVAAPALGGTADRGAGLVFPGPERSTAGAAPERRSNRRNESRGAGCSDVERPTVTGVTGLSDAAARAICGSAETGASDGVRRGGGAAEVIGAGSARVGDGAGSDGRIGSALCGAGGRDDVTAEGASTVGESAFGDGSVRGGIPVVGRRATDWRPTGGEGDTGSVLGGASGRGVARGFADSRVPGDGVIARGVGRGLVDFAT
jgi:hypothetical protein